MPETFICAQCGNRRPIAERTVFDSQELCPSCYDAETVFHGDGRRYFGVELEIDGGGTKDEIQENVEEKCRFMAEEAKKR